MKPNFKIVGPQGIFPKVQLKNTVNSKFILIASKVDARPAFFPDSKQKRQLIAFCKTQLAQLQKMDSVLDTAVFTAILRPPGADKEFVSQRKDRSRPADYDFVVLIECVDAAAAEFLLKMDDQFQLMLSRIKEAGSFTYFASASNIKRIDSVDHSKNGVFLFNYFVADDTSTNIEAWHYTAGWFQHETGLNNSTVLLPDPKTNSPYNLINHCRWDSLSDILPSLIFKKSFKTYVLANFKANSVAPIPILYKLA